MHTSAAEDRWDAAYAAKFPLYAEHRQAGRFNADRSAFAEMIEVWSIQRDMLSSLCDQHFGQTFDWLDFVDGEYGDELYLGFVSEHSLDSDGHLAEVVAFEDHGIVQKTVIPILALIHLGVLAAGVYRLISNYDDPPPAWKD